MSSCCTPPVRTTARRSPSSASPTETGTDLRLPRRLGLRAYDRLRSEGANTPADVLITVDAANLWRAKEAGLLEPVSSSALDEGVPEDLRDPDGAWYGLTPSGAHDHALRGARGARRGHDLRGPRRPALATAGCACARGTSEYNVSFVADRLAKDGRAETERMLRRWMANDPEILGSDTDVLDAIADGRLRRRPHQPLLPRARARGGSATSLWRRSGPTRPGRGTHVNLSGLGVVRGSDNRRGGHRADRVPGHARAAARLPREQPRVPGRRVL